MNGYYTDSKGVDKSIREMSYPYLQNALAVLLRDHPERTGEIAEMTVEIVRREAEYAEAKRLCMAANPGVTSEDFDNMSFASREPWMQKAREAQP